MFRWFGFFCSRLCTTNSGCSRAKSRQAGFWRLSPLSRYRIEVVGKLVDDWGGTTRVSFRFDGKILADLFLCNRRLIPPHQSLTRQLPPKGKPFQNPPHFFTTGRTSGSSEACLLLYFCLFLEYFCLLPEIVFIMFARAYKRLPLGGKLSRKRLMRGDKSALTKGIHSPTRPARQSGAIAALYTAAHLPSNPKTSLHGNRRFQNRKNLQIGTAVVVQGSSGR